MLAPEDILESKSLFEKPMTNWESPGLKQKLKNQWLTKDGKRRLISWTITFLVDEHGTTNYVIGSGIDITRQRIMEERLRSSEAELRIIFENINGIIYSLSPEEKFTFVSPGWTEHLGYDIADVENHLFETFIHPHDVSQFRCFMERVFSTGRPQKGVEYRVKHLDGTWRWHTSNGAAVKDKAGNPLYYIGLAVDTTKRKLAEKALSESERRFREMLGGVKLAGSMDNCGNITFCNDFFLELTGCRNRGTFFLFPCYWNQDKETKRTSPCFYVSYRIFF
jgi:PAS domain S-box-containing protein